MPSASSPLVAVLILSVASLTAAAASNQANQNQNPNPSSNSSEALDDILKDTILLLDVLDQKLAKVGNSTPSALMRDNLRLLHGPQQVSQQPPETGSASGGELAGRRAPVEEASSDEALTKLADGFASGRKTDDLLTSASSSSGSQEKAKQPIELITKRTSNGSGSSANKRARFLQPGQQEAGHNQDSNQQLASDSTERHIKFTLDLMQSIFASQLYSSKTNLIESFLISPLSIQTVLMMMHLGARGQTRRELANCLHLNQPVVNNVAANSFADDKLIKRRHQATSGPADSKLQAGKALPSTSPSSSSSSTAAASQQLRQSSNPQQISNAAHELFGGAVRNLLKDPIVTKALTSANQIFLQKNLPLSAQYEWSIRHHYAADVKLVDFQHQQAPTNASAPPAILPTPQQQQQQQQQQASDKGTTKLDSSPSGNQSAASANNHADQTNLQQMINDWVERQTRGKISNFLTAPLSTSTLMMAVNVLFFKGDWQYKFDPSDTEQDAWFTQANGKLVKMPMMVNRLPLAFAHDPQMKASVIELPYKAQRLGLFLLLPDEVSGIFQLMQTLNSTSFANLIASMRKPNQADGGIQQSSSNGINVRIPKFSIESSPRLSQILSQQLGLKTLFTPDVADLSGIFANSPNKRSSLINNSTLAHNNPEHPAPPQVGLDELLHKAVLQVDEQGSVAAASSATIVERVGLFNNNYFEADHPFLLFLMDKQTGLVLFSGAFAGNSPSSGQQPPTSSPNSSPSTNNNTATPN